MSKIKKSKMVVKNRFLERLKEREEKSPVPAYLEEEANIANTANQPKKEKTSDQPAEKTKLKTLSGAYTQRPYRITDSQFKAIEEIRRRYNAANQDKPELTKDEIGRIMHQLLIEQENHIEVIERLRPKASYPKPK